MIIIINNNQVNSNEREKERDWSTQKEEEEEVFPLIKDTRQYTNVTHTTQHTT